MALIPNSVRKHLQSMKLAWCTLNSTGLKLTDGDANMLVD
jgi:hypothetical protein